MGSSGTATVEDGLALRVLTFLEPGRLHLEDA